MVSFSRKANLVKPNYKEIDDLDDDNNNEDGENNNSAYITEIKEELSDQDHRPAKKRQYHRYTQDEIQKMEAFFKECLHPDDKQRKELSRQLGLDPLQIKFWFQNKRTQNKSHQERHINAQLRSKNDKLKAENQRYREAIANTSCLKCGKQTAIGEMSFEENHLRLENARLRVECTRKMAMSFPVVMAPATVPPRAFEMGMRSVGREDVYENGRNLSRSSIIGLTDVDKSRIIVLALKSMEELMKMAQVADPMWVEGAGSSFALNLDEYKKAFLWPRLKGYRIEASKETAIMVMTPTNIVEKFVDVNQWSNVFAGIVAKAMASQKLVTGVAGDFDGVLQVITADFQVLSPLVSTRKVAFARYCKRQGNDVWAVVDVSIDHIVPNLNTKCRRRPSGCIIEKVQNGHSKVTWVEHVEVDDRDGVHNLFSHLVSTGQALGASRWIATLSRHCERINNIMMATSFPSIEPDGYILIPNQCKRALLKLSERMARSFFGGMNTSTADMWSIFSGNVGDNIRVLTRKNSDDPGRPRGVILCASTTFWVSVPSNTLYDFLRDENTRTMWDLLTLGGSVQKLSHIASGSETGNCVSLLRCTNAGNGKSMMIQESSTDQTTSFVVYAPVALSKIDMVLNGGDPEYVALLPTGFAILPNGTGREPGGQGGSLLTIAHQVLADSNPSFKLTFSSVATIENMMIATMQAIKNIFCCQTA